MPRPNRARESRAKNKPKRNERIRPGRTVEFVRNLVRKEGLYVTAGMQGEVVEVFDSIIDSNGPRMFAKVKTEQGIKTVRFTSIRAVEK